MAFYLLHWGHIPTLPQRLSLWLLLVAMITLYCMENQKEPVSLLAGPTQTTLVVRNICIHLYIYVLLCNRPFQCVSFKMFMNRLIYMVTYCVVKYVLIFE